MRRMLAALLVAGAASCGGGDDGEPRLQIATPAAFEDVAQDMAALFVEEQRGYEPELVDDPTRADVVMTEGEAAMQALARDGVVDDESWNRITSNGETEIWVAIAADADEPEGALQWVSFASGASPWEVYVEHGYVGA